LCVLSITFVGQSTGCSSTRKIVVPSDAVPDSKSRAEAEELERAIKDQIGKTVQIDTKNAGTVSGRLEDYDGQVLTVKVMGPGGHPQETKTVNKSDVESISKRETNVLKTVGAVVAIAALLFGVFCLVAAGTSG